MMPLKFPAHQSPCGNVLLITLIVCAVSGIVLASSLSLIQNRSVQTMRSQSWNSAIPVLEAGIEEAFTHLRDDSSNTPTANGWTSVATGVYRKTRTFSDTSYYITTISNVVAPTTILSQGFVPAPLGRGYISRMVQVVTRQPGEFTKAIQTSGTISINPPPGTPVSIDSYNSSLGPYGGANRGANAGVATDSTAKPAISLGPAHVYGPLATGAGATVDTSKGGTAGDLSWAGPGIESGYLTEDMNVSFPNQALPSPWSPFTATSGSYSYGGTNYDYRLDSGQYQSGSLNIGVGKSAVVTGTAIWYFNGNFTVGGTGFIYIAPGASLTIYVGNGTASISGGGIANGTGLAQSLTLRGLPTCTSVAISGNGDFVGAINAPQASLTLSGNASLFGAAIAKTFSLTGGGSVHYDEGLGGTGILALSSYREL